MGARPRRIGTAAPRPSRWLLGNLRPQQGLELGWHVAPRLARTAWRRRDIALGPAVTAIATIRACGSRSAADVRVAIDTPPATTATPAASTNAPTTTAASTPAVALAVHGRLIGRPAATGTATASAAAARAPSLLGDQVFGDFRFIEVLVVADRSDRSSRGRRDRTQLRIPDRTERRCTRGATDRGTVLLLDGGPRRGSTLDVLADRGSRRHGLIGFRVAVAIRSLFGASAPTSAPAAATSATSARLQLLSATVGGCAHGRGIIGGTAAGVAIEIIEGEHLGSGQIRLRKTASRSREALTGQRDETRTAT